MTTQNSIIFDLAIQYHESYKLEAVVNLKNLCYLLKISGYRHVQIRADFDANNYSKTFVIKSYY